MSNAPCVTGGTYDGGTALLLLCPKFEVMRAPRREGGDPDVALCEAELDAEFDYGHLTLKVKACGWCKQEWTDEDRAALEKQAKDAMDNYDGPTDAQMESFYAACEPRDAWSGR